jgi:uncharacterized membrane protein
VSHAQLATPARPWSSAGFRWCALLGFALGGFFDGILLHQILQWHHLLSLVAGMQDLRLQILWDGYFHALMYLIAAVALWGLWRTGRGGGDVRGAPAIAGLLAGFGTWHVVDAVLSHWVLGIHRIKIDSPNPLAWDLGWLAVFGLLPLIFAGVAARRPPAAGLRRSGTLHAILIAALGLGAWSMAPPRSRAFVTVVLARPLAAGDLAAVLAESRAELVWADAGMTVLVLKSQSPAWRFYRRGALFVGGAGFPAGCMAWSRA